MKRIYNLPRASGKTTRLMYLSEHYQVPILCDSLAKKQYIIEKAKRVGIDIAPPITIDDLRYGERGNISQVLVDEPLLVLQNALDSMYNVTVVASAFSDEKNDNLIRVFGSPSFRDVSPDLFNKEITR